MGVPMPPLVNRPSTPLICVLLGFWQCIQSSSLYAGNSTLGQLRNNAHTELRLELTLGQASQRIESPKEQVNSYVELGLSWWHSRIDPSHHFSLGVALGELRSNFGPPDRLTIISLMPQYRYHFDRNPGARIRYLVLAAGPSWMSAHRLGLREQGSRFLFNDKIGVGTFVDRQQHWYLELVWRHFSNANLKQPNPGIDVPVTLTLGYRGF